MLNENANPTVCRAFESRFNHAVPEDKPYISIRMMGAGGLPAHLKSGIPVKRWP